MGQSTSAVEWVNHAYKTALDMVGVLLFTAVILAIVSPVVSFVGLVSWEMMGWEHPTPEQESWLRHMAILFLYGLGEIAGLAGVVLTPYGVAWYIDRRRSKPRPDEWGTYP